VFLYTVDDLGKLTQIGIERRQAAVAQAEAIIDSGVNSFMTWMSARRAVPHLQALNQRAQALQDHELERARRMLARGEPIERVLEALAAGLANKLLHGTRSALSQGRIDLDQADRLLDQWLPSTDQEPEK
jgi:glutamyl-tRNA reductase